MLLNSCQNLHNLQMKSSDIKIALTLGILTIVLIIAVQIYYFKINYDIHEKQINEKIQYALHNVSEMLCEYNKSMPPYEEIVHQYGDNIFIVNVSYKVDPKILEHYLKKEFTKQNLKLDFEYAIHDCQSKKMIFGNYVNLSENKREIASKTKFPSYNEFTYYFAVHFPYRAKYIWGNINYLFWFSGILILVIIFFGYTQYIIFRQKQLSEIQKELIDNLTHEFKTPVSSIKLASEVVCEPNIVKSPKRLKTYANIISTQSQQLISHIEHILNIAHSDAHKLEVNPTSLNLHNEINHVLQIMQPAFEKYAAKYILQLKVNPTTINADKYHFTNIVINILDNALKYTLPNPEIYIETYDKGNKTILEICDNGPGIQKVYIRKIFQKFFRIPSNNVHNVKGLGLGLHYVKKAIKAHGWKIEVINKVEKGCCFRIIM